MKMKREDSAADNPPNSTLPFGGEGNVGEGDATTPSPSPVTPEPVVYPPGRNDPSVDYGAENTERYTVGNWQGYRNYRCQWPGCQFATVSNPGVLIIEDHYRHHLMVEATQEQERRVGTRGPSGLVGPDGQPL